MSVTNFDNSHLYNFKSFRELVYHAKIRDLTPNVILVTKFGLNLDIDADVKEDIWILGGTKTDVTAAADTEIVSSSVNDTSAGTGARTVKIFGYDSNYDLISETVTLNGTTPVSLTNEFLDVYRMTVESSGSNEYNAGNITVRHVSGPVNLARIGTGFNITQQSHYIIPNGYTGYIAQFIVGVSGDQSGAGSKVGEISLEYKVDGKPWIKTFTGGFTSETGPVVYDLENVLKFDEKTRIKLTALTESNNTKAESIYTILLIKNEFVS